MKGPPFGDDPAILAAVAAPDTSHWLQTLLQSAFDRDPIDVLNDLEYALRLVKANVDRQLKRD